MAEDPEAPAQARQEELAKLAEFQVYREVPLDRVLRWGSVGLPEAG